MSEFRENQANDGGHLQNGSSFSYQSDNRGRRDSSPNNPTINIDNPQNVFIYSPSPPSSPTIPPKMSVEFEPIQKKLKDLQIDQAQRYLKRDSERGMGKEDKDDIKLEMLQEKEDLVVQLLLGKKEYEKELERQRARLRRERGRLCDPDLNPSGHERMRVKILQSQVGL